MKRIPVEQSQKVAGYSYDFETHILEIEYRWGSIIQYKQVTEELFAQFEAAPSKGSFLSKHIEHKFEFERIAGPLAKAEKDAGPLRAHDQPPPKRWRKIRIL